MAAQHLGAAPVGRTRKSGNLDLTCAAQPAFGHGDSELAVGHHDRRARATIGAGAADVLAALDIERPGTAGPRGPRVGAGARDNPGPADARFPNRWRPAL